MDVTIPDVAALAAEETAEKKQLKQLLIRKNDVRGGFEFVDVQELIYMRTLAMHPRYRSHFDWCAPDSDVLPRSHVNHPAEDYVKRYLIEQWGVRAQLALILKDKYENPQWIMTGVCPFHRRSHSSQNWAIQINMKMETQITCFHVRTGRKQMFFAAPGLPIGFVHWE